MKALEKEFSWRQLKITAWLGPILFLSLLLTLLALAALIPFQYQSQSILYKFGADKLTLRLGKIAGLLAATLLFVQILPVSRLSVMESLVSRKRLLQFHTASGIVVAMLALLHPLLVFWSEDLRALAVEIRYWPEVSGALLLLLIWIIAATARLRVFLQLSGRSWMLLHRGFVSFAALMAVVHTLFVSDTFSQSVPRAGLVTLTAGYVALWVKLRLTSWRRTVKGGS